VDIVPPPKAPAMLARTTIHPAPPLSSRKELFSHHVARGASLAQAARLAGYSPQGARQRGSVLMADSDVRLRVEVLRHAWMAERESAVKQAVERLDRIIDMALELQRPTAAMKAVEFQLKLRGVIQDARVGLYSGSPDDDLSKALFDPREDEDPDFEPNVDPDQQPHPYPDSVEAEVLIPAPEADSDETATQNDDICVHVMTVQGSVRRPLHPQPLRRFPSSAATQPPFPASVIATSNDDAALPLRR